jgi:hypothetical protein
MNMWRVGEDMGSKETDGCPLTATAVHKLHKDKGQGIVKSAEWSESDRLLMFRGKIYIPKDRELGHHIMEQHHNTCITGHTGCFKTLKPISCNYW